MTKPLPGIYGNSPFGSAAKITINNLLQKMMSHLDGTIEGSDIEALHDMRVASRRLRAALRVFKAVFPKDVFGPIEAYIKDITIALGTVRDHDVFLDFLKKYQAKNNLDINWAIQIEEASREKSRLQMISVLTSLRKGNLILDVENMLRKASDTRDGVRKYRMDVHAAGLIQPRMEDLISLSYSLTDPSNVAELHQMRISAKRLRYTMETFIPCFGKPFEDFISDVKLLQEQLGNIHDCDVWIDKLNQDLNEHLPSPELSTGIPKIIAERRDFRLNEFNQTVIHWQEMLNKQFPDRLLELVSLPGIESTIQGGTELEQEKQMDPATEETQETAQEKKPVKRRTRAKKENPVETINVETLQDEAAATDMPEAETPMMETTVITEIPEMSDETIDISEDTAKQISEPIEEMVLDVAVPVEESETDETGEAASTDKEQKATVQPETPQHPGIVNLKELIKQTSIRLTNADKFTKKMSKQLGKLDKQLDRLPNRLRKLPMKEAVKAEKYIFRLREHLSSVPEDGSITGKGVEKLRQEIRTLRNKLPSGKASR